MGQNMDCGVLFNGSNKFIVHCNLLISFFSVDIWNQEFKKIGFFFKKFSSGTLHFSDTVGSSWPHHRTQLSPSGKCMVPLRKYIKKIAIETKEDFTKNNGTACCLTGLRIIYRDHGRCGNWEWRRTVSGVRLGKAEERCLL